MCGFLFIAALKDILMSWFIKRLYKHGPELKTNIEHNFIIREIMTCFILEDLFQVSFQYFYFEKYRFEQSKTFYVNAGNRSRTIKWKLPVVRQQETRQMSRAGLLKYFSFL